MGLVTVFDKDNWFYSFRKDLYATLFSQQNFCSDDFIESEGELKKMVGEISPECEYVTFVDENR